MTYLWHSFIAHWQVWASWVFGTFIGATFRWLYPSRKEWEDGRKNRENAKIDAAVWKEIRPIGSYVLSQDSRMIANSLALGQDEVADSLERLEAQNKARRLEGSSDHPAPYWEAILR